MRYKWLNKKNNSKLIIFFNGWGMNECAVKHLDTEDFDIVMLYDYSTLDTDLQFDKEYDKINVVAWSMGVMVAGICFETSDRYTNINLLPKCKNVNSVAINGTLAPIHPKYGIHPKIYDLTIKGFDEKGRDKFVNNMFDVSTFPNGYQFTVREDTLERLKFELISLKNYKGNSEFKFNKIYISKNDKIIPTKNQVNFWGIEPNLEGGHFPFFNFSKWSEIL